MEQQGAADAHEGQVEGVGHGGATEGGLIDQQGIHPLGAQGQRRLPQDHGGGTPEVVQRGAKRRRSTQLAHAVEQLFGGSSWIVGLANRHELQAGSPHPLLRIGDADQAHPVAALPQGMAEGGHRVEMAAGGGAEQAEVGQGRGMKRREIKP
jgi:hypothetical protein